jgi:hypothetical protein
MIGRCRGGFGVPVLGLLLTVAPGRGAEADQYLPADAQVVVHVNVRGIVDSALFKKYLLEPARARWNKDGFLHASAGIGLDPFKDIHSITLAWPGSLSGGRGVAIIRGRFDLNRIQTAAEERAKASGSQTFKIHKEGAAAVYEIQDNSPGLGTAFFTFPGQEVLILSWSRAAVTAALARGAGGPPSKLSRDMQALLGQFDRNQSIWLAALPPEELRSELGGNDFLKYSAEKLQSCSGGVQITDSIRVAVRIQTADAKAASDLRKFLEGAKALVAIGLEMNDQLASYGPALAGMLNSLKLETRQNAVVLEGTITADRVEKEVRKATQKP